MPEKSEQILLDLIDKIEKQTAIVVLVTGQREDGSDFYAYLAVPPSRYPDFMEAQEEGDFNLTDFGEILIHGPGLEPPETIKQRMAEEFHVDENFEELFKMTLTDGLEQ